MVAEESLAILLQACYTYYYLSKKLKFKIRNPIVLFNLILQNKDKITDIKEFKNPDELCRKILESSGRIEVSTYEERLMLTSNAINLVEWVLHL